jgi:hypothetical protein
MTGLEVKEERERDASRQRRREEREAATFAAADEAIDRRGEERMLEVEWVADHSYSLASSLI